MSSGIRVFFIQNAPVVGLVYAKTIPARGASERRFISPRERCAGVRASSTWSAICRVPVEIVAVPAAEPRLGGGSDRGAPGHEDGGREQEEDERAAHVESVAAISGGGAPARRRPAG